MNKIFKISNIRVYSQEGQNILSGNCDGFEVWYKFPDFINPQARADAFLAASLVPAMAQGRDIEMPNDVPVSPLLLSNLDRIQDVFSRWGYDYKNLRKVSIRGGYPLPATFGLQKKISFFSGGVDGAYTFMRNLDDIEFLLFAKGIDMQLTNNELFAQALQANVNYLAGKGRAIYPFETSVRYLGHEYGLSWALCMGGGLCSIALAANVSKCYVAAGYSYGPPDYEGSNFITDRLFANEFTEIVHDGAEADRSDKLEFVTRDPDYLKILRVCWHDRSYNCGKCEKCLRTMAGLRALKLHTPTFPELTDELVNSQLSRLKLYKERDLEFYSGTLKHAEAAGDVVLIKALKKIKRNYDFRAILRSIRDYLKSWLG